MEVPMMSYVEIPMQYILVTKIWPCHLGYNVYEGSCPIMKYNQVTFEGVDRMSTLRNVHVTCQ